jgi:hypothetical protein
LNDALRIGNQLQNVLLRHFLHITSRFDRKHACIQFPGKQRHIRNDDIARGAIAFYRDDTRRIVIRNDLRDSIDIVYWNIVDPWRYICVVFYLPYSSGLVDSGSSSSKDCMRALVKPCVA